MKKDLYALLGGALPPRVYRYPSRAAAGALAAQAAAQGWRFFHVDGKQIASKDDFLRACAQAMSFPAYFGNNWDALEDSLRDLSWARAEHGYLVLFDDAGHFAAAQPHEFRVALDILRSATDSWRETSTPMAVLLRGAGRSARTVPILLQSPPKQ